MATIPKMRKEDLERVSGLGQASWSSHHGTLFQQSFSGFAEMAVPLCCRCFYTPSSDLPARGLENRPHHQEAFSPSISHHHSPSHLLDQQQDSQEELRGFITTRVIASASKIETCLNQSAHPHVLRKLALLKENKGRNASPSGQPDSFRASPS